MTDRHGLEARVEALIAAYADRAPTGVDALAVAHLAAAEATRRRGPARVRIPVRHALAFALLAVALMATMAVGALLGGGRPLRDDPEDLIDRGPVAPFIGLPPIGATPSRPEMGDLVQSYRGRPAALGQDFFRIWVYADGRVIWKSNLEGGARARLYWGSGQPTTAVIEQRLTPEGVATIAHLAPAMLADAMRRESWLPASAWADRGIRGYVPTRYAVCLEPDLSTRTLETLPTGLRSLLLDHGTVMTDTGTSKPTLRCFEVTTQAARQIVASLDEAGVRGGPNDAGLSYQVTPQPSARAWDLQILPIVPNGEIVCNCG